MPVTTPLLGFMVAIAGLVLTHVPPGVASVRVLVAPTQILVVPVIAPAATLIVTVVVAADVPQALATEYVIVAIPFATGLTTPFVAPTVATAVLLLLQVPPVVVFESVDVDPIQIPVTPVIGAAFVLTVIGNTAVVVPHELVTE